MSFFRKCINTKYTISLAIILSLQTLNASECLQVLNNKPTIEQLYLAIKNNDAKEVKLLLDSGADVSWEGYIKTPAMRAIEEAPFPVHVTSSGASLLVDHVTPLVLAIKANASIEIVKLLANHPKTDINKKFSGTTPLISAIKNERVDVVRFLSSHIDIDINLSVGSWFDSVVAFTPLMIASKTGNAEIVSLILAHTEVKPNAENNLADNWWNKTALLIAIWEKNAEIVSLILEHPDVIDLEYPIMQASRLAYGATEILDVLLGHPAVSIESLELLLKSDSYMMEPEALEQIREKIRRSKSIIHRITSRFTKNDK